MSLSSSSMWAGLVSSLLVGNALEERRIQTVRDYSRCILEDLERAIDSPNLDDLLAILQSPDVDFLGSAILVPLRDACERALGLDDQSLTGRKHASTKSSRNVLADDSGTKNPFTGFDFRPTSASAPADASSQAWEFRPQPAAPHPSHSTISGQPHDPNSQSYANFQTGAKSFQPAALQTAPGPAAGRGALSGPPLLRQEKARLPAPSKKSPSAPVSYGDRKTANDVEHDDALSFESDAGSWDGGQGIALLKAAALLNRIVWPQDATGGRRRSLAYRQDWRRTIVSIFERLLPRAPRRNGFAHPNDDQNEDPGDLPSGRRTMAEASMLAATSWQSVQWLVSSRSIDEIWRLAATHACLPILEMEQLLQILRLTVRLFAPTPTGVSTEEERRIKLDRVLDFVSLVLEGVAPTIDWCAEADRGFASSYPIRTKDSIRSAAALAASSSGAAGRASKELLTMHGFPARRISKHLHTLLGVCDGVHLWPSEMLACLQFRRDGIGTAADQAKRPARTLLNPGLAAAAGFDQYDDRDPSTMSERPMEWIHRLSSDEYGGPAQLVGDRWLELLFCLLDRPLPDDGDLISALHRQAVATIAPMSTRWKLPFIAWMFWSYRPLLFHAICCEFGVPTRVYPPRRSRHWRNGDADDPEDEGAIRHSDWPAGLPVIFELQDRPPPTQRAPNRSTAPSVDPGRQTASSLWFTLVTLSADDPHEFVAGCKPSYDRIGLQHLFAEDGDDEVEKPIDDHVQRSAVHTQKRTNWALQCECSECDVRRRAWHCARSAFYECVKRLLAADVAHVVFGYLSPLTASDFPPNRNP